MKNIEKWLRQFDRNTLGLIGLVLAFVIFISVNIMSTFAFRTVRVDLTENKLYTLDAGTRMA